MNTTCTSMSCPGCHCYCRDYNFKMLIYLLISLINAGTVTPIYMYVQCILTTCMYMCISHYSVPLIQRRKSVSKNVHNLFLCTYASYWQGGSTMLVCVAWPLMVSITSGLFVLKIHHCLVQANATNWCIKGNAMCYHTYVTMHVKDRSYFLFKHISYPIGQGYINYIKSSREAISHENMVQFPSSLSL